MPFSVALAYGGPDELEKLVRAAREAGIAVILDVVCNHFGPPDSILRVSGGGGPGWEGGICFYGTRWPGDGRPQASGRGSRPDCGRLGVRRFIGDNALGWLQDYHAGGLRSDATACIRTIGGSGSADQALPGGSLLLQEVNGDIGLARPWKLAAGQLVAGKALGARRRAGLHRSRDPDDLPGSGVPPGRSLTRNKPIHERAEDPEVQAQKQDRSQGSKAAHPSWRRLAAPGRPPGGR